MLWIIDGMFITLSSHGYSQLLYKEIKNKTMLWIIDGMVITLRSHCFSWLLSKGIKNSMKKGAALINNVAPIA